MPTMPTMSIELKYRSDTMVWIDAWPSDETNHGEAASASDAGHDDDMTLEVSSDEGSHESSYNF